MMVKLIKICIIGQSKSPVDVKQVTLYELASIGNDNNDLQTHSKKGSVAKNGTVG